MPSHRRLNAALDNTLGTFASQYTRWQGYVLLGFLDPDAAPATFDLLNPPAAFVDVVTYAHQRAAWMFYDQCRKQHVERLATVASLSLEFSAEPANCTGRTGRVLTLTARATSPYAEYTRTRKLCVCRHDPAYERYSDHR